MNKFSIVETGIRKGEIKFFVSELKKSKLIAGTEKDEYGDTVYHTHNILAVRKIADEYDGLMIDLYKK
ncbi:hypothetical protein RBH29_14590 [Herbivorax sp. ANBcel31]|uniref:hypothetical protein n=1 Tax=Herbivorax sp. ANBcel31 TaxID=3069754 RepID=UPI0027AF2FF0|nr:hypothetical protein [Herbivorax sp. ANBcel31]MDQ2087656.1 hypothetical protein [Herbivorax sp. ANBcel31]